MIATRRIGNMKVRSMLAVKKDRGEVLAVGLERFRFMKQ